MDSIASMAPPVVEARRRTSTVWSQGTSLYAQLNVPRQQIAPMRRKRSVQAGQDFQILEEEPEQAQNEPTEAFPARPTASVARSRRSRTSVVAALHPVHADADIMPAITEDETGTTQISREPRRRTIFVPSDDTTISTIHPGVKDRGDKEGKELELAAPARLRRPARTSILAAPRRGPLQAVKAPQTANNVIDRDGRATGKENVAPGLLSLSVGTEEKTTAPMTRSRVSMVGRRDSVLLAKPGSTNIAAARLGAAPHIKTQPPEQQGREKIPRLSTSRTAARQNLCQAKPVLDLRNYPPLEENISHAQMFEDSWLDNQECVLVELMNDVFARSEETRRTPALKIVREQLLKLYQDKNTLRLHQRLQASLQFGTLSVAKDSEGAAEAYRYLKDVGRRGRFIKLWTQTYQPTFLRASLEVVIGRQMIARSGERCSTRDFSTFIEGFLLQNEDAAAPEHAREGIDPIAWSWRRTMQRTLLLVYLLDKAKEKLSIGGSLFQKTSSLKSSAAVLNEVSRILHPSERTTQHCLNHIGYNISHEQHPLADFPWTVSNLATELRDGLRLARLIELLLPPCNLDDSSLDRRPSWGAPEVDTTDPASSSRYLTPHLRMPCTSRATMISNNELILDNLRASNSLDAATGEISAADLTDGHREKTLALLWALLGTAGLQRMVDWDDVTSEIDELKRQTATPSKEDDSTTTPADPLSPHSHRHNLLLEWTHLIATKHNLAVPTNLSTAFSDGRVFAALVDEYTPLLPSAMTSSSSSSVPSTATGSNTLEAKLRRLGCTATFASIFGGDIVRSFIDADFTTAALLFLASRLLSGSRRERHRRTTLRQLATDCATVVQTRLRLERAATVLQRRWRYCRVLAARKRERREEEQAERMSKKVDDNEGNVLEREVDVDFWMV